MSVRGAPAPLHYQPSSYWEERARRFAGERDGLAAVCAYGMPEFYNRAIDREQRRALEPWLAVDGETRVLDVGCGVGRWSRMLACRGARVLGIDLSPTMIDEARRRAALERGAARCRFAVHDVTDFELGERFDLVLGVTVLQHILDPAALKRAVQALARHLEPGGRMVLLEAAPGAHTDRCDSTVFTARQRELYLDLFRDSGLALAAMSGVDPAPFRARLLPYVRRMPKGLSLGALALATALTVPVNWISGPRAIDRSWHVVFVLEHANGI